MTMPGYKSDKMFPWAASASSAAQERIVSAEILSEQERSAVERGLRSIAATGQPIGVLVGVMRGRQGWDLRPLLLENVSGSGTVMLIRWSDPALALERYKYESLRQVISLIFGLKNRAAISAFGETEGQLWIKRKFYQQTAADMYRMESQSGTLVAPVQMAQRVLNALKVWHGHKIFHGHLCLENIALEGQQPVFLDPGFYAHVMPTNENTEKSAPEITGGEMITAASDIFGLGLVLRELLAQKLSADHSVMIERMLSPDSRKRPGLEEVEKCFFPPPSTSKPSVEQGLNVSSRVIKTGRVLGPNQSVTAFDPARASPVKGSGEIIRPSTNNKPLEFPAISPPVTKQLSRGYRPWLFFLLLVVATLGVLQRYGALNIYPSLAERERRYRELWQSDEIVNMVDVAKAALRDADEAARSVIVNDALQGRNRREVRSALLRAAFDPKWVNQLSPADRKVALTLALARLVPPETGRLIPLAEAGPVLILAVVGDLSLKMSEGQFSDIPVSKLTKLPMPFGWAFSELGKHGITNLGAPPAQALCHILIGNLSEEVLETYIGRESPETVVLGRLLIVLPFIELYPDIQEFVVPVLSRRGDVFSRRWEWFETEKVAEWDKVSKRDKLTLIAGYLPSSALSFEQLADLLKFPGAAVRREAAKGLADRLSAKKTGGMLSFLAGEKNGLNRYQVVALLSAFRLEGEAAYSFIARWFDTKPDPQSVMAILLERREVGKLDAFNVEASRYLAVQSWSLALPEMELLTGHQEALARALAYAKLNPRQPAELKILQAALLKEPSEKMRRQIQKKIEEAQAENRD